MQMHTRANELTTDFNDMWHIRWALTIHLQADCSSSSSRCNTAFRGINWLKP